MPDPGPGPSLAGVTRGEDVSIRLPGTEAGSAPGDGTVMTGAWASPGSIGRSGPVAGTTVRAVVSTGRRTAEESRAIFAGSASGNAGAASATSDVVFAGNGAAGAIPAPSCTSGTCGKKVGSGGFAKATGAGAPAEATGLSVAGGSIDNGTSDEARVVVRPALFVIGAAGPSVIVVADPSVVATDDGWGAGDGGPGGNATGSHANAIPSKGIGKSGKGSPGAARCCRPSPAGSEAGSCCSSRMAKSDVAVPRAVDGRPTAPCVARREENWIMVARRKVRRIHQQGSCRFGRRTGGAFSMARSSRSARAALARSSSFSTALWSRRASRVADRARARPSLACTTRRSATCAD